MSMTAGYPKKPVPPKCAECGAPKPLAVLRDGAAPDNQGGASSHTWLCGDCVYRRDHPDAAAAVKLPRERRALPLQAERLF